jgi:hypothetical protein
MQAEQLVNLVHQPCNINKAALQELKQVVHQYPYFQLAYTLIAKGVYDQDPPKAQHEIQIAAVYAPDRNHLKLLLEDKLGYAKLAEVQQVQQATNGLLGASKPVNQPVTETPQAEFINSYITNIYAKQAKQVTNKRSLTQLNIIDSFIKQGGKLRAVNIKDMSMEDAPADLTKDATDFHDGLLTESLARVMVQQGNVGRAIDIYKRLQRKFPEKRAYFLALSEKLKKDI